MDTNNKFTTSKNFADSVRKVILEGKNTKMTLDKNKCGMDTSDKSHKDREIMNKVIDEAQNLHELSKKTLGSYIRKSAIDLADASADERNQMIINAAKSNSSSKKHSKAMNKMDKRFTGIKRAVNKLTAEELELNEAQKRYSDDYIFTHHPGDPDSEEKLNHLKNAIKGTNKRVVLQGRLGKNNPNRGKYAVGVNKNYNTHQRIQNADASHFDVYVYDKPQNFNKEELELNERRGRPPKEGSEAWKKMQDVEDSPRGHIIQQLTRAKLSMNGDGPVKFNDGSTHKVSSNHASRILDKYMDLRPTDKEAMQKELASSHYNLIKHIK